MTRDSMAQIRDIPGNPGRVATLSQTKNFSRPMGTPTREFLTHNVKWEPILPSVCEDGPKF